MCKIDISKVYCAKLSLTKSIKNINYNVTLDLKGRNMKLFERFRNKIDESTEMTCDVCGNTFKSYTNSKHKNVCKECFSKINED